MAVGVLLFLLALICHSWGDTALKNLHDENFEHLTQASTGSTTGDWLVVFSMDHEKCVKCKEVEEAFEKVHEKLGHKLNVAKVWPTGSKLIRKRFDIAKWPSVYLFRHGKIYTYPSEKYEDEAFVKFVEEGFTFASNVAVPPPVSQIEIVIEDLWDDMRHIIQLRKNAAFVIFIAGILFGLLLNSVLNCVLGYLMTTFLQEPDEDQRLEEEEEEEEDGDKEEGEGNGDIEGEGEGNGEVEGEGEGNGEVEGEQDEGGGEGGVESEEGRGEGDAEGKEEEQEGKEGSVEEVGWAGEELDGQQDDDLNAEGEEDKKTK